MKKRVVVLISGRGSNMMALIEAARAKSYPARIALVVSDTPHAAGLMRAARAGVMAYAIPRKGFANRAAHEAEVERVLKETEIDLICLAGYMRLLSPEFCHRWQGRALNIHPSLLPKFPGLDTHARALAAGEKTHGASVHYVTAGMDEGPVILQESVSVLEGDTPDCLAARVLRIEHQIYPRALAMVAREPFRTFRTHPPNRRC